MNTSKQTESVRPAGSTLLGRVVVGLVLVVVTQGAVLAIQESMAPKNVREPREKLESMPLTFNNWTGNESELDAELFKAIGADQAQNRSYRDEEGCVVSLHCACWTSMTEDWLPHPPSLCYRNADWTELEGKETSLPDDPSTRVWLQQFGQEGHRVFTMYWYQVGKLTYYDYGSSRAARQSVWGTTTRPPVIKVLLQLQDGRDRNPEEVLKEFGGLVHEWTNEL